MAEPIKTLELNYPLQGCALAVPIQSSGDK